MTKAKTQEGLNWRRNSGPAIECHWSDADAQQLRLAVDAVTRRGGAIMLGLTQDGGAYSICVLSGTDKAKEYPHGAAELAQTLADIAEYFTN